MFAFLAASCFWNLTGLIESTVNSTVFSSTSLAPRSARLLGAVSGSLWGTCIASSKYGTRCVHALFEAEASWAIYEGVIFQETPPRPLPQDSRTVFIADPFKATHKYRHYRLLTRLWVHNDYFQIMVVIMLVLIVVKVSNPFHCKKNAAESSGSNSFEKALSWLGTSLVAYIDYFSGTQTLKI